MKKTIALCILAALLLTGCAHYQARPAYIDMESAKQLALDAAGLGEAQVEFVGTAMESRNGLDYYPVDFTADGTSYHYDIDALTGTVIDSTATPILPAEQEPPAQMPQSKPAQQKPAEASQGEADGITEEEAKAIALAHAGVEASAVSFVKSGLDWDDGRSAYDVEFYTADGKEYDYEIDSQTGKILDYDYDAEYYAPPQPTPDPKPAAPAETGKTISADEAKAIAIAQVPGAALSDIREFETDYDDGRLEYEGKIYFDHMEYEFEIDGYSGAIRSWDVESIFD